MTLRSGGVEVTLAELRVVDSARSTAVESVDRALRLSTVEHLFAALAGAHVRHGVAIEIEGPEVPLADGGARAFVELLASLPLARSEPSLRVVRPGVVAVGDSRYELVPFDGLEVEVEIDFGDARLARTARWNGDADDFRERIAPARTFGFAREVDELARRGLATHVEPESVVVMSDEAILSAGRPFVPDEPARHKLLDLVGDLYLHGGPPLGRVRALRPGHAATHEAVRQALHRGLLARGPRAWTPDAPRTSALDR